MLTAYSIYPDFNEKACEFIQNQGIQLVLSKTSKRPNPEELEKIIQQYDIIILGIKEKLTKEILDNIEQPKIIATLSMGLDHIAPEYFISNRVTVVNCPTSNATSVAEHIIGLILALKKRILEGNKIVLNKGDRTQITKKAEDISNNKIGLIGAGRIARAFIDMISGFQMQISCYTKNIEQSQDLIEKGVTFTDLNTILEQSDIIVENVPLTPETKNLIGKEQITKMKKTAVFINTSRDKVADIKALMEYADENANFMVGMDIDTQDYHEIFAIERNNVIITPHIAGTTVQAIQRMELELAQNIVKEVEKRKNEDGRLNRI